MKYLITFMLTLLFCFPSIGQTGPGGIGSTTNNLLWLRSQDLSALSNGDNIYNWQDTSGNSNHVSQPDTVFTAEYQANIVNGHPIVRFNKTNGRLRKTAFTSFPTTAITAIYVNRNNGETGDGVLSYASSSSNNDFLLFRSNNINLYRGNSNTASGVSANDNNWHIINAMWSSTAGNFKVWKDGDPSHDITGYRTGTSITAGGSFAIAGEQDAPDANYAANQAHFGDFTEVILYNTELNYAENIIISNYLSAKYGLTLDSNDLYDADNAGNGDYDFEVAGIGQAPDGSNNTDAIGTGMVGMSNATGLGNNEFLIWGHDNGAAFATETSDIPAALDARLDRVWRASEADTSGTSVDVGAVDVRFDLTNKGPVTASDLRLLIDTDNDGLFSDETPISGATSIGGDVYEFAGVTAITDSLRFTIGTIDALATPIPIELTYFTASLLNNGSVQLDWETATEINNHYFTVEHSHNGINWTTIAQLSGAEKSTSTLQYTTLHEAPLQGNNYYRLSQTDYNGITAYFQTQKVTVNGSSSEVKIYPNPTTGSITIEGELDFIEVYTILGENISGKIKQTKITDSEIILELSALEAGMYYLKMPTAAYRVYKK